VNWRSSSHASERTSRSYARGPRSRRAAQSSPSSTAPIWGTCSTLSDSGISIARKKFCGGNQAIRMANCWSLQLLVETSRPSNCDLYLPGVVPATLWKARVKLACEENPVASAMSAICRSFVASSRVASPKR
jgi:hypothetical protein